MAIRSRGNNNKILGYSEESLRALERGKYDQLTGRDPKYRTSQQQTNQVKELPRVKNMTKATPVNVSLSTKPSTRYNNRNVLKTPRTSTRDTKFDKDLDELWNYRFGDFSGEVDYDPVMDIDKPHWQTVREQIKRRNKWTDEELDTRFKAYDEERLQKTADQLVESDIKFAKKHPVAGTLLQALYTPQNMIEGAAAMLSNLAPDKYKAQSADDTLFTGTREKEAIKQAVKDEHIKSGLGKGAYDIGTSVGDMLMSAGIPILGTAALGTQAAARSNMQALERGVDPKKAALTGATSGVISGVLNKVGLDKALGKTGKTAVDAIKKAALTEGLENVTEDTANLAIDSLLNRDKSQLNTLHDYYVSQGMDDNAAWVQVAKDTGVDLGSSALSGAAFGGVMSAGKNLPALRGILGNRNKTETGIAEVDNAIKQTNDATAKIQELSDQIPETENRPLTDEELDALNAELNNMWAPDAGESAPTSNVDFKASVHNADGQLLDTVKVPEYSADSNVYFNGSDADIAMAEAQEAAIIDTFKNIVSDPEFNALSFKNGNKEVFVSPATNGNGLRMSYTIDGVPTGHHDYSLDQLDELSKSLRNEAGNGGEDIKIQRKSDFAKKAENKAANESAARNPRLVQKLEGEERVQAETKKNANDSEIRDINKRIKTLDELIKTSKGKKKTELQAQKKAETKRRTELQTENKGLKRSLEGGTIPVEEYLKDTNSELHKEIYGRKTGLFDNLNYVAKHAGDTPEAKQLVKDIKKSIEDFAETGDINSTIYSPETIAKINQLDTLANTVDAEYIGHFRDNATFIGNDGNPSIWNALEGTNEEGGLLKKIGRYYDENIRFDESTEAPTDNSNIPPDNGNVPPNNGGNSPDEPPIDISQRYETLKNSDLFQKSEANMKMLETAKEQGVFDKGIEGRKQAQEEALKEYLADPQKAREANLNKAWDSGKDVDTAMLVLHDALDSGDQAEANLVLLKQVQQSKGAARQLRANRDYAGTKEGTLTKAAEYLGDKADKVLKNRKTKDQFEAMAERIVNGELSDLSSKLNMDEANIDSIRKAVDAGAGKADIVNMIAMYQAVGKTGISQDSLQKISDIYDKIQNDNLSPNSKERAQLEADAFKVLADDIGGKRSWGEMWDAWRYLAMLGNPKTHLRNIIGNTTHYMVTEAKDNVGAVLEAALDKATSRKGGIERTKSILTRADESLLDAAAKDADSEAYAALNDKGHKYNVKDEIGRARNSFNNKTLSKIDDFNSKMLDYEDSSALKRKYSKSLARFLKANGADESIFNATDDASKALLDKGRAYAVDQAKQATFHEYSRLAESLNMFSKRLVESDRLRDKAGYYMLEGILPFKKTPINILKQGGKYSPLSLAKAIGTTFQAVKTGSKSASDAIEDLASGLTGTGIMALGAFLASKGLLTGSANEDYTVDNAETEQGAQNYALKIGNGSYTLDWLAPLSLPLFVGVEAYNLAQKKKEDIGINEVLSALSTLGEPVTEMSMLQGINNALEELSYSPVNALGTMAANTALGYATQGVPTMAGQFARAMDDTRRSTYSDKNGAERQLDKAKTKIVNKLPWLSETSEPYIDARGQEQKNEGFFANKLGGGFVPNLMDQMLSPGYYKQGNVTPVDEELNRLYNNGEGQNVYLDVASGKVNNEKLSKSDFTKYQKLYGQTNDALYKSIISSKEYQALDDTQRAEILSNAKKMSKLIADHEIGGKELDKSAQKTYDLYKEQDIDGLVQNLKDKTAAKSLDMDVDTYLKKQDEYKGGAEQYAKDKQNLDALNQKYGTKVSMETYTKQGARGTEQYIQDQQKAIEYGFTQKDGSANTDSYNKAVEIVGNNDNALKAYSNYQQKNFEKDAQKVPYLMNDRTLTNEQKGKILRGTDPSKLGKAAKGMYDLGGYEGVYYYYLLKNLADTNQNGSVTKAERAALLNSNNQYVTQIPDDMYYYLGKNLE